MCDLLPSCSPQALGKAPAAEGGFRFCWGFEPSSMPVLWEGVCAQHNPSSVGRGAEPWLGGNLLLPSSHTTDSCAFFGMKTVHYSVLPFPWPSLPSPVLSMPLLCLCGAKSPFPSSAIPNQSYIPLLIHDCIQTPPSLSCVQLDLLDLLAVLKW